MSSDDLTVGVTAKRTVLWDTMEIKIEHRSVDCSNLGGMTIRDSTYSTVNVSALAVLA